MAANVNKAVTVEILTDEDLHKWVLTVADGLRKLADDLELVEMQLSGRLRNMKVVEGNANSKTRNVVMHIKMARVTIWSARKSILGVYKAFLKQFGPEIEAVRKPTAKAKEGLVINT
jgi:hypothetical protein